MLFRSPNFVIAHPSPWMAMLLRATVAAIALGVALLAAIDAIAFLTAPLGRSGAVTELQPHGAPRTSANVNVAADGLRLAAAGGVAVAALALAATHRRPQVWRSRVAARAEVRPGEKVVGIDLGTTNSAVAAMEAGTPTIIPNAEGARTTPSVVAYSKGGELLVGQIAKRQAVINAENTFYSVKRFVGRQVSEIEEELKEVSYTVESSGAKLQIDCPAAGKKICTRGNFCTGFEEVGRRCW